MQKENDESNKMFRVVQKLIKKTAVAACQNAVIECKELSAGHLEKKESDNHG